MIGMHHKEKETSELKSNERQIAAKKASEFRFRLRLSLQPDGQRIEQNGEGKYGQLVVYIVSGVVYFGVRYFIVNNVNKIDKKYDELLKSKITVKQSGGRTQRAGTADAARQLR